MRLALFYDNTRARPELVHQMWGLWYCGVDPRCGRLRTILGADSQSATRSLSSLTL